MGYIYMLTSPSGKSYIGQTYRPIQERLREHRIGKSRDCVAIYNAIQKYGWENFEKDYYEVPDDDLNKHEELMIEVIGTLAPDGYNLKEGGSNGRHSEETKIKIKEKNTGLSRSAETKKKISEANQGSKNSMFGIKGDKHPMFGIPRSEHTKQKLREANIGKKLTEETKQKLSEARIGKIPTEETKQKLREKLLGKKHTEESKQKMSDAKRGEKNSCSRRVYQYDSHGKLINSFGSVVDAASYLGKNDGSTIGKCAIGTRKTAYGFSWSFDFIP
jgi:group I intron endonuclease